MAKIDTLRETEADDVPESSRFLLEMDYDSCFQTSTIKLIGLWQQRRRSKQARGRQTKESDNELNSASVHLHQQEKDLKSLKWRKKFILFAGPTHQIEEEEQ